MLIAIVVHVYALLPNFSLNADQTQVRANNYRSDGKRLKDVHCACVLCTRWTLVL